MSIDHVFHPTLVGEIFASRFQSIGEDEIVELSELGVFKEYYFNSLFDDSTMIGPLGSVNHNPRSGLTFKK